MAKDNPGYFMVIPALVWNAKIRDKAKLCYGHITVLAGKEGYCYASNAYFAEQLGVSKISASQYISELEAVGAIQCKIILKENSKEVKERRIYLTLTATEDIFNGPTKDIFKGNNTRDNNININIDDAKKKAFFKLVELYPSDRIGNRQHGLKKFLALDTDKCKLALINAPRYIKAAGDFVKSLQNYITEECFTEEWLDTTEQRNKSKSGRITNNVIDNAEVLKNRDKGFYD